MSDDDNDDNTPIDDRLISVSRLNRDLVLASVTLSDAEARFLVDAYYQMQDSRIRAAGQVRSIEKAKEGSGAPSEPHQVLSWMTDQSSILEKQVQRALDKYSAEHPDGTWLRSVVGIGPVIAAGLLAHIDIAECNTVGKLWAYAGLDPTRKWEKGKRRPHNADLKVLCWKAGESFIKHQNRPGCIYGQFFVKRRDYEVMNNQTGKLVAAAEKALTRKFDKNTEAYKWYSRGMLPPAHIHARARRWAVKLFLSHLHEMIYRRVYKKDPPNPYPLAYLGHVDMLKPEWVRGPAIKE